MLSDCMEINSSGVLVYLGHHGAKYEVVGGTNGKINLKEI